MKKGILFTITTFLILFSLMMLTLSHYERKKQIQAQLFTTRTGDSINYLADDLVSNLFYDLYGISISPILTQDNTTTITISGGQLSAGIDHKQLIQDYESFVEQNYSMLLNTQIQLENIESSFNISPYNSTYQINKTTLFFLTDYWNQIESIQLEIKLDKPHVNMSINDTPLDSGSIQIGVEIYDNHGNQLLSDTMASLNPQAANTQFKTIFDDGSKVEVKFGYHLDRSGTVVIEATDLVANISQIAITYNETHTPITIEAGDLHISKPAGISIQTPIRLI